MRLVVADTGPLHYLVLTGDIGLLPKLFAEVLVPQRVRDELADREAPALLRAWIAAPPAWSEPTHGSLNFGARRSTHERFRENQPSGTLRCYASPSERFFCVNVFAHHVHVSFEDQSINDICQNLDLAAKDYGDVVVDTRGRFSTSAVALIMKLTNRPHYVAKRRLGRVDWKI